GDLKGAGDAAPANLMRGEPGDLAALEADRAGARRQGAGDQVEDRRLARAVRSNEAEDLAWLDRERHAIDREKPAEPLRKTGDFEHSVRARQKLDERDDGGALRDQQADDPFDRVGFGFGNLYLQIGAELSQI